MTPEAELSRNQRALTTTRSEFGAVETEFAGDTARAGIQAREQAAIQAEYIMAERHPRNWLDVRSAMLDHCKRPRFAEVARFARPVGNEKNEEGKWVPKIATGWSTRFTEVLMQEMRNVKAISSVVWEDDLLRQIRFLVIDLERNVPRGREVTFAKAVERRGFRNRKGEWEPPAGREILSERLNSEGVPVYLVRATDTEMRNVCNSEESKTFRDLIAKLCPRDILEECETQVAETLRTEDKKDPQAALKRILDRFAEFGITPSQLETYIGKPAKQWTSTPGGDFEILRGLGAAIREGGITFDQALRERYDTEGSTEAQENVAEAKIAELRRQQAEAQPAPAPAPEPPPAENPPGTAPPPPAPKSRLRL